MRILSKEATRLIPVVPQTQAALNDQLHDLAFVAQKLGLHDAADYLKDKVGIR